ncbi:MAG: hypothetical protein H0U26_05510, partial [Acidimicrobiia bacterium]|nr:hypothetical protein [Acidimicrobiia bacterium]
MAWAWTALVAALLPIAVATVRALGRGWLPIGDNAIFAIRARDVLSFDPPLLGTWTSASLSTGGALNNPGPLLFDLLAVPTATADGGIAVGVALLNGLAVIGIVLFAARRGGVLAAAGAAATAAALCWAMGSELLFDPWQPHSLLLPFLLLLVLVWSTTCGDLVALPLALAVASFVLQTHLTYAVLMPVLVTWAAVGLVLELRRRRRRHPDSWPALRRRVLRSVAVTAVVLVACWAQPVFEQVTSDGDGNLTRLARSLSDPPEQVIGAGLGVRLLTSVTTFPPWWFRSSFGNAFLPPGSARSAG